MTDPVHAFRLTIFRPERSYRLEPDGLAWSDAREQGRVPYADITGVRVSSIPPR